MGDELGLDRLLNRVQEIAINLAQLSQKFSDSTRRVETLERLFDKINDMTNEVARINERLIHGNKKFEEYGDLIELAATTVNCADKHSRVDKALEEKVDKKTVKTLLIGISIGSSLAGGGLAIGISKLLTLF